jgi:hypothetical protein
MGDKALTPDKAKIVGPPRLPHDMERLNGGSTASGSIREDERTDESDEQRTTPYPSGVRFTTRHELKTTLGSGTPPAVQPTEPETDGNESRETPEFEMKRKIFLRIRKELETFRQRAGEIDAEKNPEIFNIMIELYRRAIFELHFIPNFPDCSGEERYNTQLALINCLNDNNNWHNPETSIPNLIDEVQKILGIPDSQLE